MISLNQNFLKRQTHRNRVRKLLPRTGNEGNRDKLEKEHKLSVIRKKGIYTKFSFHYPLLFSKGKKII